jgi:type III secretory pathway component EscV
VAAKYAMDIQQKNGPQEAARILHMVAHAFRSGQKDTWWEQQPLNAQVPIMLDLEKKLRDAATTQEIDQVFAALQLWADATGVEFKHDPCNDWPNDCNDPALISQVAHEQE